MPLPDLRAFGNDRLTIEEETAVLDCRVSKGWRGRTKAPGTTVVWQGALFEVISEETIAGGGVRYALVLWSESESVRTIERYDVASEKERAEKRRLMLARMRLRPWILLVSPILGLAPARQLEQIESEYAIHATTLAAISSFAPLAVGSLALVFLFVSMFTRVDVPLPLLLAGSVMWIESLFRLGGAARGDAIGSLLGVFVWNFIRLIGLLGRLAKRLIGGSSPAR